MSCPVVRPLIVAHRGASFDAPENTLSAFRLAWEQGADAVEGDFHSTKDSQIVCLHDATFKRTARLDSKPSELTLDQIRKLDVGAWKGAKFAGEPVPTLAEVLATVPPGKRMFIEIKCSAEILPAMKRVIESSAVPFNQLRLICFDGGVVAKSKKLMPSMRAYWLTDFPAAQGHSQKCPAVDEVLKALASCGADGLAARADLTVVNEDFVARIREAGYEIHFWTVDDPQVARRLMALGAVSITTNRPQFLRNSLP